ncbi:MAG TPA: hypothetical protein VFO10_17970 [Oligoflexus sp.]|uniref:hypothetical protein n=1 Tax=Oligoflexus sp. TaxID=1971216 RepID=UPI002D80574F|nr:hypothetical protein [Oligoflexus sp.]HET9239152.1 hypothetical protein [Oligoflexus sp.]
MRLCNLLLIGLLLQAAQAWSYPVPLGTRQPLQIPAKFVDQYTFFEDHESPTALYVVPRIGTIDLRQAGSTVWPRFVFSTGIHSNGYFLGYDYVRLGGTLRGDARPGLFQELAALTRTWGLTLSYAPFWSSQPEIISLGRIRSPGEHLDCRFETRLLQDGIKTISLPHCVIRENGREVDIDLFQNFALLMPDGGEVNDPIGWSARTLPGWELPIRQKLEQGAGWDDLFVLSVQWGLAAAGQGRAVIESHAARIYDKLESLARTDSRTSWTLPDLEQLSQQIMDCGEACGFRSAASQDKRMHQALTTWMQNKFFILMKQDGQDLWIPKSFPLNETMLTDQWTREALPLAGEGASVAETRFLIHCLLTPDDGSTRVRWDTDAPDCQEGREL